jgi:hypothetical protein
MLSNWKQYQGCFYPLLAVVTLLLVLSLLAEIVQLDKAIIPKPKLTPITDYPASMTFREIIHFTDTAIKWLMLTYFYWLTGLITMIFCSLQLQKSLHGFPIVKRRIVYGIYFSAIGITALSLIYTVAVEGKALMSFGFLLKNLTMIGSGMVNLTIYNTALAYLTVVAIIISISLLLIPNSHGNDTTRQISAITQIMYAAAAFLLIWVTQATEMYRFATMLLIEAEREEALNFAPTISLVVGVFASFLLAAAYISAYFWLQLSFRKSLPESMAAENIVQDNSPKKFMLTHWPKITAVLMPILPGVISTVLNSLGQAV